MTSLAEICGIKFWLDEETGEFRLSEDMKFEREDYIDIKDIVPVLLNRFVKYPEKVYKHFKRVSFDDDISIFDNADISYDLLNLPNGLLGIEYVKSHIYYSDAKKNKYACVAEVMKGEITVLIQKNSDEDEPFTMTKLVDEIQLIRMKEGDKLAIPSGVYYTFINTGTRKAMVAIVVSKSSDKTSYVDLEKEKGLAYYVISKNAKVEVVANPKYKCNELPVRRRIDDFDQNIKERFMHELIEGADQPLYNLAKNKLSIFSEVIA